MPIGVLLLVDSYPKALNANTQLVSSLYLLLPVFSYHGFSSMIFFDGPKEPKSRCRWRTKNILERIEPTPLLIEVYGQSVYTQKSLYRYNGYIHIYIQMMMMIMIMSMTRDVWYGLER